MEEKLQFEISLIEFKKEKKKKEKQSVVSLERAFLDDETIS